MFSIKGTALTPNLGMALFASCASCLPAEPVKLWHLILGSALMCYPMCSSQVDKIP